MVYLIVRIRYYLTDMGEFKFTVNYIIDTGDDNSEPLTPQDFEYFRLNKRHPRLMQYTIGYSIYGINWYRDLKLRIADMAEKYQNTYIYGIGINLYGAEKPNYLDASRMEPEVVMNSVWDIVKEQPPGNDIDQETARLVMMEEDLRERERMVGLKDKAQDYHQSKDETQGNHQSKDDILGNHQSKDEILGNHQSKDDTQGNHQSKDDTQGFVASKRTGQYIPTSKPDKNTKAFLVGDIETILVDDIHVPYAMGYVYAGERSSSILDIKKPITYCTENIYYKGSFKERSRLMFDDFLNGLISYSKRKKVYFHNLSRFDGILLLKLLLEDESKWLLKPVIREHNV